MGITTEQAKIDIYVNNEAAKNKIRELNAELVAFQQQRKDAVKEGNTDLAKQITNQVRTIKTQLKDARKRVVDVDKALRNLNKITPGQLRETLTQLRTKLKDLNQDSIEYMETQVQINKVEEQLAAGRTKRTQSISNGWKILGGGALIAMFQRMASRAIDVYASLDDKMADVIKTTGLAKDEVKELDQILMSIDTRSSREELLDLARIAGKLGVEGVDNVAGFVRAADQINVALAEDLGGNAEESIRIIGKLVDIFKLEEKLGLEGSLMSIGSAINSLGAASTANEQSIVDFTNRAAGVGPKADISIEKILGLAASVDRLGQSAEVGATTFSQVITGMFKRTEEYAKVAGMSVSDFSELLKKDANEAFLVFLEGVNRTGDMSGVVNSLSDLKLAGQRSTQVIGALSGNVDMIREQQALASEEFEKATSITEEYNTKNESAQAIIEKKKRLSSRR